MPKRTLLEETALLIASMVRDARRRRKVGVDETTGKPRYVAADISDKAKAAAAALAFMGAKEKLDPEKEESQFERDLAQFHGQGKGDAAGGKAANGTARAGD
jgi:hypothetical protein